MLDRPVAFESVTLGEAKVRLNEWLYQCTEGKVQSGPFAGMTLLREEFWKDGNLSPKLLGCYEQDLHEFIEREIVRLAQKPEPRIVNIGCAEGYYAVGLAGRLPAAKIWAVDTNEAMEIASRAAAANGVPPLIIQDSVHEVFAAPDLLVVDCEGAEVLYLDLERFPALRGASIIVECHDTGQQPTSQILWRRFCDSHEIWAVSEGPRNPNRFELLQGLPSMARWLAVSEGRPCLMNWFLMTPKGEP